ncbi:MAG: molybdopterin-dependent oxidoreductase [Eubacteriales bacterium]|nr:molybdopterin-dependent oxidoreductase [Eubacteriales bacterium]
MKRLFPLILALLVMLTGCVALKPEPGNAEADAASAATQSRYRENEITEYQGARLDPAVGPRDNSISGVQHVDIVGYTLIIDGLVDQQTTLSYDQVLALDAYERLITLHCVEGWDASILWKGVLLNDLIALAGAKPEATTVIFTAVDGYTTSLPLATIREKGLILAYGANGLDLPDEMGYPFIVVAEDKLGYKWARWVNRITLSDDASYQGFWESNGYSNEADIPQE